MHLSNPIRPAAIMLLSTAAPLSFANSFRVKTSLRQARLLIALQINGGQHHGFSVHEAKSPTPSLKLCKQNETDLMHGWVTSKVVQVLRNGIKTVYVQL